MYMERKADFFLREWKADPNRKPLIIKGSRQVGKTETIRHFAKENYKSVIEINFVEEPKSVCQILIFRTNFLHCSLNDTAKSGIINNRQREIQCRQLIWS